MLCWGNRGERKGQSELKDCMSTRVALSEEGGRTRSGEGATLDRRKAGRRKRSRRGTVSAAKMGNEEYEGKRREVLK